MLANPVQNSCHVPVVLDLLHDLYAKFPCDSMWQINMDTCPRPLQISQKQKRFGCGALLWWTKENWEQNLGDNAQSQDVWKRCVEKCVTSYCRNYSSFALFWAENQFGTRKNRCRGEPRPANVRSRWSGKTRAKIGKNVRFCILYQLAEYEAQNSWRWRDTSNSRFLHGKCLKSEIFAKFRVPTLLQNSLERLDWHEKNIAKWC